MNKPLFFVIFALAAFAFFPVPSAVYAEISNPPVFSLPVKCNLGSDCYIMHYVDLDPGDNEVDFG